MSTVNLKNTKPFRETKAELSRMAMDGKVTKALRVCSDGGKTAQMTKAELIIISLHTSVYERINIEMNVQNQSNVERLGK